MKKVYKFRGGDSIKRTLDILLNKRLYCAGYESFNDPREGFYFAEKGNYKEELFRKIRSLKKKFHICSLSKDIKHPLMWAHYASGYTGVAIEMSLPECKLYSVKYEKQPLISPNKLESAEMIPRIMEDIATKALLCKRSTWEYESEIRILHNERFYQIADCSNSGEITALILGEKTSKEDEKMWRELCGALDIPVKNTQVDEDGYVSIKD